MELDGTFINNEDFNLIQQLGEGSFGIVYKSQNKKDHQIYATKIFKKEKEFNKEDQELFMRELLIISKLHHQAILKFIGVSFNSFTDSTKLEPSITTEYFSRGSLQKILNDERLSLSELDWNSTKKHICLLGIADALRFIHKNKILHRDLKPANILIDDNYYPHVCDFGLSKCFEEELTKSANIKMTQKFGTLKYNAPEIIENEGEYGPGIDVYSYGIIAYEIATNKEPFYELGEISPINFGIKITDGYLPKFDETDITDKMKELIIKCLSKEPKQRPSFEEIVQLLSNDFTYLNGQIDNNEIIDYIENLQNDETEMEDEKNYIEKLKNELDIANKKIYDLNIDLEVETKKNLFNQNTTKKLKKCISIMEQSNDIKYKSDYFSLLLAIQSVDFSPKLQQKISSILNNDSLQFQYKLKNCFECINIYYLNKINKIISNISNILFHKIYPIDEFTEKIQEVHNKFNFIKKICKNQNDKIIKYKNKCEEDDKIIARNTNYIKELETQNQNLKKEIKMKSTIDIEKITNEASESTFQYISLKQEILNLKRKIAEKENEIAIMEINFADQLKEQIEKDKEEQDNILLFINESLNPILNYNQPAYENTNGSLIENIMNKIHFILRSLENEKLMNADKFMASK